MKAFVVDENVPIVANDAARMNMRLAVAASQADDDCRLACVRKLREVVKQGFVVVDEEGEILRLYRESLDGRGQPGVGDAFLKHVVDRQFDRRKVRRSSLKRLASGEFSDFPSDDGLATFDRSDRIYVAMAIAAKEKPKILNAVDSDYADHSTPLRKVGVTVEELCLKNFRRET